MNQADIVMLIVCVPLLIMMGVLVYVLLALILKEEFEKTIWPFNKKEEKNDNLYYIFSETGNRKHG